MFSYSLERLPICKRPINPKVMILCMHDPRPNPRPNSTLSTIVYSQIIQHIIVKSFQKKTYTTFRIVSCMIYGVSHSKQCIMNWIKVLVRYTECVQHWTGTTFDHYHKVRLVALYNFTSISTLSLYLLRCDPITIDHTVIHNQLVSICNTKLPH